MYPCININDLINLYKEYQSTVVDTGWRRCGQTTTHGLVIFQFRLCSCARREGPESSCVYFRLSYWEANDQLMPSFYSFIFKLSASFDGQSTWRTSNCTESRKHNWRMLTMLGCDGWFGGLRTHSCKLEPTLWVLFLHNERYKPCRTERKSCCSHSAQQYPHFPRRLSFSFRKMVVVAC